MIFKALATPVALLTLTERMAEGDVEAMPKILLTYNPVVVALPRKLALLVTLKEPRLAPPVTDSEVEVAANNDVVPATERLLFT